MADETLGGHAIQRGSPEGARERGDEDNLAPRVNAGERHARDRNPVAPSGL